MNSAELLRWLVRQPFEPFRIRMTDGAAFVVKHPDEVVPLKSTATVARSSSGKASRTPMTIALLHVIRLEPLDAT